MLNKIRNYVSNAIAFGKELRDFCTWDFSFNLKLFCRSLELTRLAMLSESAVSARASRNAREIQKFLELINRYENSIDFAEEELGMSIDDIPWALSERTPEQEERMDRVCKLSDEIEQKAWNDAMDLLRERMQYWWD
jgi:hypothetical protein